jgi:hypothetical protein
MIFFIYIMGNYESNIFTMSKNTFILLLTILLIAPFQAESQILRGLTKKIEERVEKRVDRKQAEQESKLDNQIDAAIDQLLNAPENAIEEGRSNQTAPVSVGQMNEMIAASNNLPLESTYQFHQKITYEYKDNRSGPEQMSYWLSNDSDLFAMEVDRNLMVYDFENESIMIISDREKTIQVMTMDWIRSFGDQFEMMLPEEDDQTTSQATFNKVPGATKTIAGHKSKKYEFSDENSYGELWFTSEADVNLVDITQNLMGMFSANYDLPSGEDTPFASKFMMQAISTDKETNSTSTMTVTNISQESKTIQTAQYQRVTF